MAPEIKRVRLGEITGPHGVRGAVRIRSDTGNPRDIAALGPLSDATGSRTFALRLAGKSPALKGHLVATIEGVTSREAAQALRGQELFVARDRLAEPEPEEYYHADLIGLAADAPDGTALGRVTSVMNFGAGDLLEIDAGGARVVVPFTRATVPAIELERGRLVVDIPAELAPPARKLPSARPRYAARKPRAKA